MTISNSVVDQAKGGGVGPQLALLYYLSVGLLFEPIPDRHAFRALLCFGPFRTYEEAKRYLGRIRDRINSCEPTTVTIARMAKSTSGEPETQTVAHRPLSFVGGNTHDQRAIAQLTPAGLEQYLLLNGAGDVIAPYEVDAKGKTQQDPLGLLPYYIMRTLDRHYGPRRVI